MIPLLETMFAGEQQATAQINKSNGTPSLTISTDHNTYSTGDIITIFGRFFNGTGFPAKAVVAIQVNKTHEARLGNPLLGSDPLLKPAETIQRISVVTSKNGFYNTTTRVTDGGKYQITAIITNSGATTENAFSQFEASGLFTTIPFLFLYSAVGFLIGLLAIIPFSAPKSTSEQAADVHGILLERRKARLEILRFLCLTGIVASIIGALLFSDVELGVNSPLGLVRQHPLVGKQSNTTQTAGQWVINVGGSPVNNYTEGIQIPATVVIFGLLGGYLRYLYGLRYLYATKSEDPKNVEPQWGDIDLTDPLWSFKHSLRSLALIFLAPLLAIAIWFVIFQGGTTGKFAIAAISLVIGLVTEEAIQALIAFARNLLSGIKGISPSSAETKETLKITSKFPEDRATGLSAKPPPTIKGTFSEVLDKTTVNHNSFKITDINNLELPGIENAKYDLSNDGQTAMLTPPNLEASKTYIITITTQLKDIKGNSLGQTAKWWFKTA